MKSDLRRVAGLTRCERWVVLAVAAFGLALLPCAGAADQPVNLAKNGDAETGTLDGWTGFSKVSPDKPHAGKFCFIAQGSVQVTGAEFIPIDPAKTYTLGAWMKSLGNPSVVYAGYIAYDADKNPILVHEVLTVPGTETALVEPVAPADKVIKVADGSKWQVLEWGCVAFGADDSGKFADLPNRKLSTYNVVKVENKGKYWEIQLKEGCGQTWPAGTKIREHQSGGTYIYNAAYGVTAATQWAQCTGTMQGVAESGAPQDKWWHGTKYAKIMFLLNYGQAADVSIAVDDITLTAK